MSQILAKRANNDSLKPRQECLDPHSRNQNPPLQMLINCIQPQRVEPSGTQTALTIRTMGATTFHHVCLILLQHRPLPFRSESDLSILQLLSNSYPRVGLLERWPSPFRWSRPLLFLGGGCSQNTPPLRSPAILRPIPQLFCPSRIPFLLSIILDMWDVALARCR